MIHSTWADWFVRDEVEAATPNRLAIWYLGCNGFILRSPETTLYIDPYFGDGDPPNIVRMIPVPMDPADATTCDAVLVSHEHIDHMHPPSYGPLVNDLDADLFAPPAAYDQPDYEGPLRVPDARRRVVTPGDQFRIGDLDVHVRGANDPDAIDEVSLIVDHASGTFFHGGDSRPAPDIFPDIAAEFDIDVGALAFGSVGNIYEPETDRVERTRWYMDENELVEAANQLELDRLLPSHYDMWRGVGADPGALAHHAQSYPYPRVIEHAQIGDRFAVDRPGRDRALSLRPSAPE